MPDPLPSDIVAETTKYRDHFPFPILSRSMPHPARAPGRAPSWLAQFETQLMVVAHDHDVRSRSSPRF
jgi:hypothetical protein